MSLGIALTLASLSAVPAAPPSPAALPSPAAGPTTSLAESGARAQDPRLAERVAATVERALDEHGVAGLSLSVALGSDVFLEDGWGYADAAGHAPAEADSVYRAGSLTRQLAAVAALRLADDGRLELDADVAELLPELRGTGAVDEAEDEDAAEAVEAAAVKPLGVRVRDLLAHTSGLPDYGAYFASPADGGAADATADELIAWVGAQPLEFEPGTCAAYSRTDTLLLGRILERATGQALGDLFEEHFFGPLQLDATGYRWKGPALDELAAATQELGGRLVREGDGPPPFDALALCTQVSDLRTWTRAVVERELVDDAAFDRLVTPARLEDGTECAAGFAFAPTPLGDEEGWSFGGGMGGCRLHVAHYPSLDLTISVLARGEDAPVDRIERSVARLFFELPEPGLQDLELEPLERERYVGGYYEACSLIEIREQGDHLVLAETGGPPERLLYQGYHVFAFASDPDVRLTFTLEEGDERATVLTIDARGTSRRAVRRR